MKTRGISLFEGTIISLVAYYAIHKLVTGSVEAVNWISGFYGYTLVPNAHEVYTTIGGFGIFGTLILTAITHRFKVTEINVWHYTSALIGMIIYAGYITSITMP